MIGSLLPPVIPNGSLGVANGASDDAPSVRDAVASRLAEAGWAERDADERGPGIGRHDFVHAARHMIGDALKTFAHDLRDSFHELGFKSDMIARLAHDVMKAAKQALKSGADFSASLMMAAVSQTTVTGAAGSASSIALAASGIEITINHSTRSVEVNATQVEIQTVLASGVGAPAPQIVDFLDTEGPAAGADTALLLASGDLEAILAAGQQDGEGEALDPVLDTLPDGTVPAAGSDPADEAEIAATEADGAAAVAGEDGGDPVPVPAFAGVSHVVIKAFERYVNAEGDAFTYIKLDALVPLNPPAPADTVTDQVIENATEEAQTPAEVPLAQQVIGESAGQTATTDLIA